METTKVSGVKYTQQLVEFLFPGLLFSESTTRRISDRDRENDNPGEIPEGCFGYRYISRQITKMDDGEEFVGEAFNISGKHYFGKVYTLEQVQRFKPESEYRILVSNMKNNGYDKIVQTIQGNFQPLEERDVVIS